MSKLSEFDDAVRVGRWVYFLDCLLLVFMFGPIVLSLVLSLVNHDNIYWAFSAAAIITFPLGIMGFAKVSKMASDEDDSDYNDRLNKLIKESMAPPKKPAKLFTDAERDYEISCHKTLLIKGIISQEEFKKRVDEVNSKSENPYVYVPEKKPIDELPTENKGDIKASEKETIEILERYASLLTQGLITKEEFEAKKKELLHH